MAHPECGPRFDAAFLCYVGSIGCDPDGTVHFLGCERQQDDLYDCITGGP